MNRLVLAVLTLLLLTGSAWGAQHDTSFRFRSIETTHFSIHFHQGLEEAARRTATIAEEVHGTLTGEFLWEPREKTQVVLIDDSDFANGMASVLPYNTIFLQAVPPALDSTIGEYDDWLRILFVHEYSHILTMDPDRGYSQVLRHIFGKPLPGEDPFSLLLFIAAAPPNVFLPRWWHEGIATWSETEQSRAGRGRSTTYEMILRSAVYDNNLPGIDAVNGDGPDWPRGHLPYIFGLRLQKYIADKYGKDAPGRLSKAHAGRFPYLISWPPEELSDGKNYQDLYAEMLADLKREQGERIALLEKTPFTPSRQVEGDGENLTTPRFSPDGKLIAYNRHDPHGHAEIVIADPENREVRARFRRRASDDGITWAPDGSGLYFSQAEINDGFNVYEDIYFYDLGRDRVERLTKGLRGREPELSPDGTMLALVVGSRGSQNLALLEAAAARRGEGKEALRPVSDFPLMRVATPHWSPDGKQIVYSLTTGSGKSGLYLYDVGEKRHTPLVTGAFNAAYPTWSRDGRTIFYVSDETGVFNLFAFPLDEGNSHQVSHVPGGAIQPDVSPDGSTLVYSSYGSHGFKIAAMSAERRDWLPELSPAVTPYWPEGVKSAVTAGPAPAAAEPVPEAVPYSPLGTLLPRFWLPTVVSDSTDTSIVGAFTAGADVLGYHSYVAQVAYGEKFKKIFHSLAYRNDSFYPSLFLQTYNQEVIYADLLQRGDYYEENRGVIARMSVPLNFLESRYLFFTGFQVQDQRALSPLRNNQFNTLPVFQGRRDNLFAGFEFGNALKYPYSISHEEGRNLSFLYRRFDKSLGSDLDGEEFTASYGEYFRLPSESLRHQVIYYNLSGGVANGEQTVQQAFQIGGLPSMLNSFPLRGYPSRFETGKYVATGTIEYRAPVWYLLRGFGTKPLFLEKLHNALFVDAGEVWDDTRPFKMSRLKVGAGIEARLDITLGYWLKITPAVGYAHGFNKGGEDQVYINIYANL